MSFLSIQGGQQHCSMGQYKPSLPSALLSRVKGNQIDCQGQGRLGNSAELHAGQCRACATAALGSQSSALLFGKASDRLLC